MRISDWSSDVCSSDLTSGSRLRPGRSPPETLPQPAPVSIGRGAPAFHPCKWPSTPVGPGRTLPPVSLGCQYFPPGRTRNGCQPQEDFRLRKRSEEHTSELQSLMRSSYAVFCLKKKKKQ